MLLLSIIAVVLQAPADTLSLEAALRHARVHRAVPAMAAAGVAGARGEERLAGLIPNPRVQFEHDQSSPTNKMTISQPLDWIIRRGSATAAGREGVVRAAADSQQVLAEFGREVRVAFYRALAADAGRTIAALQMQIADSIGVLAARRYDAGDISSLELDQAILEAGRARLAFSRARELSQQAAAALARAVGWEGPVPPVAAGAIDEGLDLDLSLLVAAPLGDLPPVRGAVADSTRFSATLRAVSRSRLPIPSVIVGREWGPSWSTAAGSIIGFSVPLPLWNIGGSETAIAQARAEGAAGLPAEARLDAARRLRQADARVEESAIRGRLVRDSLLPRARQVREGTLRLFDAGQVGILATFEAMRSERDIADTLVAELLAFQEARAERLAALGQWQ